MVVVGEELLVACDDDNNRLQVFSLAGEHRRSITGEWKRPLALCFVKDRLYLLEQCDDDKDEEGNFIYPQPGRRIFVVSLQGGTLQVYTHPVEGQIFSDGLCCFDGKLLASRPRQAPRRGVCRGGRPVWGIGYLDAFTKFSAFSRVSTCESRGRSRTQLRTGRK